MQSRLAAESPSPAPHRLQHPRAEEARVHWPPLKQASMAAAVRELAPVLVPARAPAMVLVRLPALRLPPLLAPPLLAPAPLASLPGHSRAAAQAQRQVPVQVLVRRFRRSRPGGPSQTRSGRSRRIRPAQESECDTASGRACRPRSLASAASGRAAGWPTPVPEYSRPLLQAAAVEPLQRPVEPSAPEAVIPERARSAAAVPQQGHPVRVQVVRRGDRARTVSRRATAAGSAHRAAVEAPPEFRPRLGDPGRNASRSAAARLRTSVGSEDNVA